MGVRDEELSSAETQVYGDDTEVDAGAAPVPRPDEPAEARLEPGDEVDHFRVKRLIGHGGMGTVYLARDTRLGRKVALKVIQPRRLGSPDAAARFLEEARTTARFAHPHIVTIHAVGEHRGRPYLALEFLEGESLRQRMREGRGAPREAMRVGLAIASALAEAHRHGVLHRDLKPGNVVIARDGRPRVVDFGLATMADDAPPRESLDDDSALQAPPRPPSESRVSGTPAYMAPEQWRNEPLTPAVDVWALGLILIELVAGEHPYRAVSGSPYALASRVGDDGAVPLPEALAEAPLRLRQLIQRCVDKDPALRPAAGEVEDELRRLLSAAPLPGDDACPFRGLLPFGERHAGLFFGRDEELSTFLERLREEPVLPVVGPSGAGKSSFVRGGVVPRLREQGDWLVLALRPGPEPFAALATRLAAPERAGVEESQTPSRFSSAGRGSAPGASRELERRGAERQAAALQELLRKAPTALNLELQRLADVQRCRVLLFVDQLEELFALDGPDEERRAFMEAICAAADDPAAPVRVIFTLRDDFLGQAAVGARVREALSRVTVLRSPGEHALREILTRPLEAVDHRYDDPALVDDVIAAVRGEPASLPLVQFALRSLWEARDRERRVLPRAAYDAMGGVGGALAAHADGVLQALQPAQVRAARTILLRLVTPRGTRRLVRASAVLEGLGGEGREVLGVLTQARLLTARRTVGQEDASPMVELAHESLIGSWRQLAHWIDDSQEELALLEEVGLAAQRWERRGRPDDELWTGDALRDARRRLDGIASPVPAAVRAFLDAGVARERRAARRRRRLNVGIVAVSLLVAVAAVGAAVAFRDQARELERQRNLSDQRRAEGLREGAVAAWERGDLLAARAQVRGSLEIVDSPRSRALWWTMAQQPRRWRLGMHTQVNDLALAPDGSFVAAGCLDRRVHLIDVATRQQRLLPEMGASVWAAKLDPTGHRLAMGSRSGDLRVVDLARDEVIVERKLGGGLSYLDWSPDGGAVAATNPGQVAVWDLERPDEPWYRLVDTPRLTGVALADGLVVTGAADGSVRIWTVGSDDPPRVLEGHEARVVGVDVAAGRIASASYDGTVGVWDLDSGRLLHRLAASDEYVEEAALSPDGRRLATAGSDGTVRVWDPATGALERVLKDLEEEVWALSFDATGELLAAAGTYEQVQVWDLRAEGDPYPPGGHAGPITVLAVHPDGETFATGGLDGVVGWWDRASGRQIARSTGHDGGVYSILFAPDGETLATGGWDATIRLWDPVTARERAVLTGHAGRVGALAFSADGRRLYSADTSGTLIRWELHPRARETAAWTDPSGSLFGLALTDGERQLAITDHAGQVRLLDAETLAPRGILAPDAMANDVAASPDGRHLVTGNGDGELVLLDRVGGRHRVLHDGDEHLYGVAFGPRGETVAAAGAGGRLRVVALDGTVLLDVRSSDQTLGDVVYTPDGAAVLATGVEPAVRAWRLRDGVAEWRGPLLRDAPVRLLTHRGWIDDRGEITPPADPPAAWTRAVERTAARADRRGDLGCLVTRDGELQRWDAARGEVEARHPGASGPVVALAGGCAVLLDRRVVLLAADGGVRDLSDDVTALAPDGEGLLLSAGDRVVVVDGTGAVTAERSGLPGATALTRLDERLALALPGGSIELVPPAGGEAPAWTFEGVPSSRAVRLIPGPAETLVGGFAGGEVVVWSLRDGQRLFHTQLHGPAIHLAIEGDRVLAGSDLGDAVSLDLTVLGADRCAVLRQVWDDVPVGWQSGGAVRAPVPSGHACAPRDPG